MGDSALDSRALGLKIVTDLSLVQAPPLTQHEPGPRTPQAPPPLLLKNSHQVRVMAPIGKANPRLPLLGLTALIQSQLQVVSDGENARFRVYRSLRAFLSEWYRGLST